jgi:nitroreductase
MNTGDLEPMNVSDAVRRRQSVRQFLSDPIDDDVVRDLLELSARAPSGGNLQPWRIYVINGEAMTRFREFMADIPIGPGEYEIYPANLWEPYRTNRFEVGEQMYATIGIERNDKTARINQFAKNGSFFDSPCGLFCFIDRKMGPPQWSDLGMFLQTFMLLAQERGIDTCPQEYWTILHESVREFVDAPAEQLLFCGMAIGHADWDAPINSLESERIAFDEWARFV